MGVSQALRGSLISRNGRISQNSAEKLSEKCRRRPEHGLSGHPRGTVLGLICPLDTTRIYALSPTRISCRTVSLCEVRGHGVGIGARKAHFEAVFTPFGALALPLPCPGIAVSGVSGASSSVARLPSRWLVFPAMPDIPLLWATYFSAALLILEHLWVEFPQALCLLAAPVHDYPVSVVLHHLLDGDRVVFGTETADPATRLDD